MLQKTDSPRPPEKQAKRKKLSPTTGRMLRRLNELRAFAKGRAKDGTPLRDLDKWAMLIADCLLYHTSPGRRSVRKSAGRELGEESRPEPNDGCDYYMFRDTLRQEAPMLYASLDEDTVMAAIHKVNRIVNWQGKNYRPIRAKTAGEWLDLTADERQRYGITTMTATNETPSEAKARVAEDKAE